MVAAAGLGELNVEPGSMQIDALNAADVTVRVTVIGSVPKTAIDQLVVAYFSGGISP